MRWVRAVSATTCSARKIARQRTMPTAGAIKRATSSMSRRTLWLGNSLIVVVSLIIASAGVELVLRTRSIWHQSAAAPAVAMPAPPPALSTTDREEIPREVLAKTEPRRNLIIMPEEWKRVSVQIPGAYRAFRWHGNIEVQNEYRMRWTTPFPAKRPDVYRVMVVGDSLTYGEGLPEEDTFVSLLNNWMARDYRIEFLNLGVPGFNSDDILKVVKTFLPQLMPDLVLYAVCLNDFLRSGQGEYEATYAFPLPEGLKRFFIEQTRFGTLLNESYDTVLRRLHFRRDFFDDILRDFAGNQQQFRRDVFDMNATVRTAGLPPMVGLVLNQFVEHEGRGHRIARVAENYLAEAGVDVISTEDYYRTYHGQSMRVSQWDGHPDEVANYIWARMIFRQLDQRSDIKKYKR